MDNNEKRSGGVKGDFADPDEEVIWEDEVGEDQNNLDPTSQAYMDDEAIIQAAVEAEIARVVASRNQKLIADGVSPPLTKEEILREKRMAAEAKRASAKKEREKNKAPAYSGSKEIAERTLLAMQKLARIGVTNAIFADALEISRPAVNNILNEKRNGKLRGDMKELSAIREIADGIKYELYEVFDILYEDDRWGENNSGENEDGTEDEDMPIDNEEFEGFADE